MMQAALRKSGAAATRGSRMAIGATRSMSGKEIKFGVEGRAAMLRGVDLLADAVQVRFSVYFPFSFDFSGNFLEYVEFYVD